MRYLQKVIYFFFLLIVLSCFSTSAQVNKSFKNGILFYSNGNAKDKAATTSKLIDQLIANGITVSSTWQIDSLFALTPEAPHFKSVFSFENDKVISNETFITFNSSWLKSHLEINEYDGNNNRKFHLLKDWYNNEWQDFARITFEYNDESKEIYSLSELYNGSVWVNISRTSSDYYDQNYKETLHQYFEDGLWQNASFIKDYYVSSDIPEYSIRQIWNNNQWQDYLHISREFNELNKLTNIDVYLWENGSLELVARVKYLYNENNQIDKQKFYEKINENNWDLVFRQSYLYDENYNAVEIVNEDSVYGQWQPVNAPIVINFPHGYSIGYVSYKVHLFYSNISDIKELPGVVKDFLLYQNFPNPFNPSTTINFSLSTSQFTTLKVYDALGREIKTLINKNLSPGNYEVTFDGSELTSGVYFYVLESGGNRLSRKMLLLK